jgi:signal transduction histidine kinase
MAAELPLSRVPRWWRAGVTAAVVLVAFVLGLAAVGATAAHPAPHRFVALVLELAGLILLIWRRRAPELIVGLETVIALLIIFVGPAVTGTGQFFAVVVALYALATTGRAMRSVIIAGVSGLLIGAAQWYRTGNPGQLATCVIFFAGVTAVSFYVRSRRALVESYRVRAEQAEREQQWETARAVAAERVRIARELHDVVAHHVSLLVVQAGAVRETLPADHLTRPVLDSMIDGGRHAMTELREMLDALRIEDRAAAPLPPHAGSPGLPGQASSPEPPGPAGSPAPPAPTQPVSADPPSPLPLAPQPTVEEIPALVGGARTAGLPVELEITGEVLPLPPSTSMAVYRIVQEGLTNVIKHAPGAPATVELAYQPGGVELTVRNRRLIDTTGKLPASTGSGNGGPGYGIIGMRERAMLAHGTLDVGPDLEGWRLHAWLPIQSPQGIRSSATFRSAGAGAELGSR